MFFHQSKESYKNGYLKIPSADDLWLLEHRTYQTSSGATVIIAENFSHWVILSAEEYEFLQKSPNRIAENTEILSKLQQARLVTSTDPSKLSLTSLKTPNYLLINLTDACNYDCRYCYSYDRTHHSKTVDFDLICRTISQMCRVNKIVMISFHGGEPLLRFNLLERIVSFATKTFKGINRIRFMMQTNASLLTPEIITFLEKHHFLVSVSLDGISESSNCFRVSRTSQRTPLQNFDYLINYHKKFVQKQCVVTAVVGKNNVSTMPEFAIWLQPHEIKRLNFSFLETNDETSELHKFILDDKDMASLCNNLFEAIKEQSIQTIVIGKIALVLNAINGGYSRSMSFYNPGILNAWQVCADNTFKLCTMTKHGLVTFKARDPKELLDDPLRQNIFSELSSFKENACAACPFFGICISNNLVKLDINTNNIAFPQRNYCTFTKIICKKIFDQLASPNDDRYLIDYYLRTQ